MDDTRLNVQKGGVGIVNNAMTDRQADKIADAIKSVGHCLISGAFMIYMSILLHACIGH